MGTGFINVETIRPALISVAISERLKYINKLIAIKYRGYILRSLFL
jgi:hypothetical protein